MVLLAAPSLVLAAPDFKLELIAPKEPVKVSKEQVAQLEKLPELVKALEAAQKNDRPDLKQLKVLESGINAARSIDQGINLTLRFTNNGKAAVRLFYGADTSRNALTIEGGGAIELPYRGMMTTEFRIPEPTEIKPGESKEFTIKGLAHGTRDSDRWFVFKAGTYQATCQFSMNHEEEKIELSSTKAAFEVKVE
jgi:hypothetical protein